MHYCLCDAGTGLQRAPTAGLYGGNAGNAGTHVGESRTARQKWGSVELAPAAAGMGALVGG